MKQDVQETFNARYLSYEHIAKTFIENGQYIELLKNNHTLLMGPRGSGKTTLLKMLTPACQYYLKSLYPKHKDIGFIAIYIPADIQWNKQIDVFSNENGFPKSVKETFPKFLVTSNILISLINTFIQIFEIENKHLNDDELLSMEINLCSNLIDNWKINKPVAPTLNSIKQALSIRLADGNALLNKIKYGTLDPKDTVLPDYFYNDYVDLVSIGCNAFEDVFKFSSFNQKKWAFCFDELEIAPEWLQMDLLVKTRSIDQRYIFKLTTSPIVSFVNRLDNQDLSIEAREDEDFKIVRTWNFDSKGLKSWNIFSDKLITQKIQRHFDDEHLTPINIFGTDSDIRNLTRTLGQPRTRTKNKDSHYENGGYYWTLFRDLAEVDLSFKKFLESKRINPKNPLPISDGQMDQIFRKVKEVVLYRFHFRNSNNGKRGRKNPTLNYGLPMIYELCDGNPRFLISLIDALLPSITTTGKIPINRQSTVISEYSYKYLSLIASHPDSTVALSKGKSLNLAKLIIEIGDFFFERLVLDDFKMDVKSTFIVDNNVPDKIIKLITLGVHLGAFIYLDPKKAFSRDGIIGSKFRLSYLLNPNFNLPKREYEHVNLSTILSLSTKKHTPQLKFTV